MFTDISLAQWVDETGVFVLRIYEWTGIAVSVGIHQRLDQLVKDTISDSNIPIVRRPTGGRGILHDGDITYSVICPHSALGGEGEGIYSSYKCLSRITGKALSSLGLYTAPGSSIGQARSGDCFSHSTHADMNTIDGQKLVGCAQRRFSKTLLQQCSIRYRASSIPIDRIFVNGVNPRSFPLKDFTKQQIHLALVASFEWRFGPFVPFDLNNSKFKELLELNGHSYEKICIDLQYVL